MDFVKIVTKALEDNDYIVIDARDKIIDADGDIQCRVHYMGTAGDFLGGTERISAVIAMYLYDMADDELETATLKLRNDIEGYSEIVYVGNIKRAGKFGKAGDIDVFELQVMSAFVK